MTASIALRALWVRVFKIGHHPLSPVILILTLSKNQDVTPARERSFTVHLTCTSH